MSNAYANDRKDPLVLTVSATGLLEIAINHDSAEQLLSLTDLKKVEILFV